MHWTYDYAGATIVAIPAHRTTRLAAGREIRELRGRQHLFQEALRADVAFVRARAVDELGNLVYDKTARNFNPEMATAARIVVAEVDEIVPVGAVAPEQIVTPHLFVDHLVEARWSVSDAVAARVARQGVHFNRRKGVRLQPALTTAAAGT